MLKERKLPADLQKEIATIQATIIRACQSQGTRTPGMGEVLSHVLRGTKPNPDTPYGMALAGASVDDFERFIADEYHAGRTLEGFKPPIQRHYVQDGKNTRRGVDIGTGAGRHLHTVMNALISKTIKPILPPEANLTDWVGFEAIARNIAGNR